MCQGERARKKLRGVSARLDAASGHGGPPHTLVASLRSSTPLTPAARVVVRGAKAAAPPRASFARAVRRRARRRARRWLPRRRLPGTARPCWSGARIRRVGWRSARAGPRPWEIGGTSAGAGPCPWLGRTCRAACRAAGAPLRTGRRRRHAPRSRGAAAEECGRASGRASAEPPRRCQTRARGLKRRALASRQRVVMGSALAVYTMSMRIEVCVCDAD